MLICIENEIFLLKLNELFHEIDGSQVDILSIVERFFVIN